jgi:hypothetical protein
MASINFPPTDPIDPHYSEFHQQNGYTWEWDGIAWRVSGRPQLVLPPGTTVGPDAPTQPENGQAWFDTRTYNLMMWVINPDTNVTGWNPVMRYTTFYSSNTPVGAEVGDFWYNVVTNRTFIYTNPNGWVEVNQRLAVQSTSPGEVYPDTSMYYDPNTGEIGIPQATVDEIVALRQELEDVKAFVNYVPTP